MYITRDDKKIELSREEMYDAYMEIKRGFLADDVRCLLEDMIDRYELPSLEELEHDGTIERSVEHFIARHDSELSHWQNVEGAIRCVLDLW